MRRRCARLRSDARREDNANQATAKSRNDRVVPVGAIVLAYYDRYLEERWTWVARTGYDAGAELFAPDADDPLFGYTDCKTAACDQVAKTSLGLCWRCDQLWKAAGPGADSAAFCKTAPGPLRRRRTTALRAVCRTAPGAELRADMGALRTDMGVGFAAVDARFDQVDTEIREIKDRLAS